LGGTMASAEHEPITEVWGLKTVYFVSELGAQSAWCPNPVIGGTVPPRLRRLWNHDVEMGMV